MAAPGSAAHASLRNGGLSHMWWDHPVSCWATKCVIPYCSRRRIGRQWPRVNARRAAVLKHRDTALRHRFP